MFSRVTDRYLSWLQELPQNGMYVGTYSAKNKRAIKNRTKQLASRYSRKVRSTTQKDHNGDN